MSEIAHAAAREVLDSRGNPTVEVDVILATVDMGRASVPSGASKGELEAVELRDGGKKRYRGKGVLKKYSIVSIEDGLAEDDWKRWSLHMRRLGDRIQIVGDDIFVTNREYGRGIRENAANSVLIKVNQTGTLTETMQTVETARRAGFTTVFSHRSGETEDAWLADVVVGYAGGQLKTGSTSRSERLAKYNQLMRIEEELGASAVFRGREVK